MRSRRKRISTWLSSSPGLRPHRRLTRCSCRRTSRRARKPYRVDPRLKCLLSPSRETCLSSAPSQTAAPFKPSPGRPSPQNVQHSSVPTRSRKQTLTVKSLSWSASLASQPMTGSVAASTKSWRRKASGRASCSLWMASNKKSRVS